MPTKIEWTEETWNPITGCSPVSEGCAHCYAQRMATRLRGRAGYDAEDPFRVTIHQDRFGQPMRWRKPKMAFVCSMGDLFHKDAPKADVVRVIDTMARLPEHTFQVLTKRPERMRDILAAYTPEDLAPWPLPNVWLGVTAENQARADDRIPVLLDTPAAVRFVSVEPMLGPVALNRVKDGMPYAGYSAGGLDWVICGGETGPGAREMKPEWALDLRDQCKARGVPFFFKKWGHGLSLQYEQLAEINLMPREYPTT